MTDKLELKSSHEVVYTVDVADVDSIFYCKPTDPDILTVLMKDGKRLYCDEVCPIDSLQEEPVSEDLLSKVDKQAKCIWDEINTGHDYSIIDSYNQFYGICMQIAESVQEEPVSEELEEASKEWLIPQLDKSYVNYGEVKMMELTHFDGYAMLDAIEFGAKWQKQQMMAKAIDGVVTFDYYDSGDRTYGCVAHDSFCLEDFGIKDRDKVKVIVIKEE